MLERRIIHRFWATYRKVLDKNRIDLMASRLRFRHSNGKREIETRCDLSRLLVSETRHVKTRRITQRFWAKCRKVFDKNRLDFKADYVFASRASPTENVESRLVATCLDDSFQKRDTLKRGLKRDFIFL